MDRGKAENGDDLIHSEPETVIQPTPAPISSSTAPPPFLIKTYDMVDDPSTDAVISWSSSNNSFVVWNPPELGVLLPKYFKHSNFSSFVRQLNTYGFRKVDPDRWEFAHEGFLRDQKHLLKKIRRRRPLHGHSQPHTQQPQSANSACVEVGKFGLEGEVGRLKRDKNVLMQELVRLRQQQQSTDHQLQTTVQRLQGMEQRQQQIMSFLAKVVRSPGFLVQFVKQQSESKGIPEGNKRRRVKSEHKCGASSSDGQIVKYQSYPNETEKAMFRQLWDMNGYLRSESFNNKHDSVPVSGVRSSNMPDKGTSSSPTSGSVLQYSLTNSEKPATLEATDCKTTAGVGKDQSSSVGIVSEVTSHQQSQNLDALFVTHEAPQVSRSQSDAIMDEFPLYPDMTCQSIADSSNNKLLFGPTSFEEDGAFPLDIDNISLDPDIEAFFNEDEELWDMLNEKSEGIHTTTDGATPSKSSLPAQPGQLDSLTEQMGLPPSDPKKTI